jgi:hypothetical protein
MVKAFFMVLRGLLVPGERGTLVECDLDPIGSVADVRQIISGILPDLELDFEIGGQWVGNSCALWNVCNGQTDLVVHSGCMVGYISINKYVD